MAKNVLIIGGYGGVGKHLAELMAKEGLHNIIIGGRDQLKGSALKTKLSSKYPNSRIQFKIIDATSDRSLHQGMEGVDLAVITATVPDRMEAIARIAIEQKVDLVDILVREDVESQLRKYEQQVEEDGRTFITQGGFHPGMILPMMKVACSTIEKPKEANVYMAMAPVFDNAESTKEIFYEVNNTKPILLIDGAWKQAKYSNSPTMEFSPDFGKRTCFPLNMPEIYGVDKELGLKNAGTYVAGFHWFIDYFIFSLAVILGKINVNLSQKICSQLLFKFSKMLKNKGPLVEMISRASGSKNGAFQEVEVRLKSNNGYLLTAQAIYSLIKQYSSGTIHTYGVHLMGKIIDENQLMKDLKAMDVHIE